MNWMTCFFLAMAMFAGGIVWAVVLERQRGKQNRILSPMNLLLGGTFAVIKTVGNRYRGPVIHENGRITIKH